MTTSSFAATGEPPRIERVEAFAFHDATGRIRHMHHHIVLEGAEPRPVEAMLDEIRAHALSLGNDLSKLRVLHVMTPFSPSMQHKVDVKKGVLVEVKPPSRALVPPGGPPRRKR